MINNLKRNIKKGFTMAELLLVVAIIIILGALASVGVIYYQRELKLTEMDNTAKELFIAAQNHLSVMKVEGLLEETSVNERYLIYDGTTPEILPKDTKIEDSAEWKNILPFASIDDKVRINGSYIIKYDPSSATINEVFYSDNYKFKNELFSDNKYVEALTNAIPNGEDSKKNERKKFNGTNLVIGYYGGAEGASVSVESLHEPTLTIENGDQLKVIVTLNELDVEGTNPKSNFGSVKLIITDDNGHKAVLSTTQNTDEPSKFSCILDDVSNEDLQFTKILTDFIPGQDIHVQAIVVPMTSKLENGTIVSSARSQIQTTNSLFADGTDTENSIANISSFRHLINLSNSSLYSSAMQISDIDWTEFLGNVDKHDYLYSPLSLNRDFIYNGYNYRVQNLVVSNGKNVGLFGDVSNNLNVTDLILDDFKLNGNNVGSLIGNVTANTTTLSGILVRSFNAQNGVYGTNTAGGIVGNISNDGSLNILLSSASSYVQARNIAGGMIGTIDTNGTVNIMQSYVGGHTSNKEYLTVTTENTTGRMNIYTTGESGVSGGLIGSIARSTSVNVEASYSTASVKGKTAGSLIGNNEAAITANAVYGSGLVIANEEETEDAVGNGNQDGINLFNYREKTYTHSAYPYDNSLVSSRSVANGLFDLPNIQDLTNDDVTEYPYFIHYHFGDWKLLDELKKVKQLNVDFWIENPDNPGDISKDIVFDLDHSVEMTQNSSGINQQTVMLSDDSETLASVYFPTKIDNTKSRLYKQYKDYYIAAIYYYPYEGDTFTSEDKKDSNKVTYNPATGLYTQTIDGNTIEYTECTFKNVTKHIHAYVELKKLDENPDIITIKQVLKSGNTDRIRNTYYVSKKDDTVSYDIKTMLPNYTFRGVYYEQTGENEVEGNGDKFTIKNGSTIIYAIYDRNETYQINIQSYSHLNDKLTQFGSSPVIHGAVDYNKVNNTKTRRTVELDVDFLYETPSLKPTEVKQVINGESKTVLKKNADGTWKSYSEEVTYNQETGKIHIKTNKPFDLQIIYEGEQVQYEVHHNFHNSQPLVDDVTEDEDDTTKYTVIWKNDNGAILKTVENVIYADAYTTYGEIPKKNTEEIKNRWGNLTSRTEYRFAGWEEIRDLNKSTITYTATYISKKSTRVNPILGNSYWHDDEQWKKYTVKWVDDDGTVLKTDSNIEYGSTTPNYNGDIPTKSSDFASSYVFSEWVPVFTNVYSDTSRVYTNLTFKAKYTKIANGNLDTSNLIYSENRDDVNTYVQRFNATAGVYVVPEELTGLEGFTRSSVISPTQVNADGKTVINIEYTRDSYSLLYDLQGGRYNENGVTSSMRSSTYYEYGKPLNLEVSGDTFYKQGYSLGDKNGYEWYVVDYDSYSSNNSNPLSIKDGTYYDIGKTKYTMPSHNVYAVALWKENETADVTVEIFRQKASDDIYKVNSGEVEKTYDYYTSATIQLKPSSKPTIKDIFSQFSAAKSNDVSAPLPKNTARYTDHDSDLNATETGSKLYSYDYFDLNLEKTKSEIGEVNADGSTIIRLYYDREEMSITFNYLPYSDKTNYTKYPIYEVTNISEVQLESVKCRKIEVKKDEVKSGYDYRKICNLSSTEQYYGNIPLYTRYNGEYFEISKYKNNRYVYTYSNGRTYYVPDNSSIYEKYELTKTIYTYGEWSEHEFTPTYGLDKNRGTYFGHSLSNSNDSSSNTYYVSERDYETYFNDLDLNANYSTYNIVDDYKLEYISFDTSGIQQNKLKWVVNGKGYILAEVDYSNRRMQNNSFKIIGYYGQSFSDYLYKGLYYFDSHFDIVLNRYICNSLYFWTYKIENGYLSGRRIMTYFSGSNYGSSNDDIYYAENPDENNYIAKFYTEKIDDGRTAYNTSSFNLNNFEIYNVQMSQDIQQAITLPLYSIFNGYTPYGYTQDNSVINTDNKTIRFKENSVEGKENISIYHIRETYSLTFSNIDNDVTTQMLYQEKLDSNFLINNQLIDVSAPDNIDSDYIFLGWFTSIADDAVQVADADGTIKSEFIMPANNMRLFAHWAKPTKTVYMHYDPTDSEKVIPVTIEKGQTIQEAIEAAKNVEGFTTEFKNYHFNDEWYLDNEHKQEAVKSANILNDMDLYASYEQTSGTVSYVIVAKNENGNEIDRKIVEDGAEIGETITIPVSSLPTFEGYIPAPDETEKDVLITKNMQEIPYRYVTNSKAWTYTAQYNVTMDDGYSFELFNEERTTHDFSAVLSPNSDDTRLSGYNLVGINGNTGLTSTIVNKPSEGESVSVTFNYVPDFANSIELVGNSSIYNGRPLVSYFNIDKNLKESFTSNGYRWIEHIEYYDSNGEKMDGEPVDAGRYVAKGTVSLQKGDNEPVEIWNSEDYNITALVQIQRRAIVLESNSHVFAQVTDQDKVTNYSDTGVHYASDNTLVGNDRIKITNNTSVSSKTLTTGVNNVFSYEADANTNLNNYYIEVRYGKLSVSNVDFSTESPKTDKNYTFPES